MIPDEVKQLIRMALAEDIGAGDITASSFVPEGKQARGTILAKETGIVAGIEVAREVFRTLDPAIKTAALRSDGDAVHRTDAVITLEGPARSILTGERTALNFLQRLSGIATQTRRYVDVVAGTSTKILDTRKTIPGWRWLEKNAVSAGGGTNHRAGLYDMVMVKDNHLQAAGDLAELQAGIDRAHAARPGVKIEIEADSTDQVRQFLMLRGVDVILLDNMSLEAMRESVSLVHGTGIKLEASGNVTLERLPEIAATGVDFISSGALTHSVKALDLSLDFEGTAL
ncbi:MAG TPA: carboxylating nicotinate-nucleotide diphosphorylase [Verrucomicrobiales bacterium]|nr:carboxylating nicotinate-nucleotide diphosphorylase [Verrucomicrobiales bacterium]